LTLAGSADEDPGVDLTNGVSFELAPHTGFMGGSGIFGLRLSMNYGSFNFEVSGEQVAGKTANMYPLYANAILNLSTKGHFLPYGSVGAGLMLTVPTTTIGDQTISTLGVSFGGGARFYLTDVFGFRLEGKQYITSVDAQNGQTDELLFFQELSVGVTFLLR
jgi:opacity protein-like surface antigen